MGGEPADAGGGGASVDDGVLAVPEPEALFGDALRLPLSALVESDAELSWRVSSSDASVAEVRIVDGLLLVEPQPGAEGSVVVEAMATDARGRTATVRFSVQVEFHWPTGPVRGWRGAIQPD